MPEKLYRIAPLAWSDKGPDADGDVFCLASTPFGSYTANLRDGRVTWGYCFDEYYDEANHECDSIEHGKSLAEQHWRERLEAALEEESDGD